MICKMCDKWNDDTAKFCGGCGVVIEHKTSFETHVFIQSHSKSLNKYKVIGIILTVFLHLLVSIPILLLVQSGRSKDSRIDYEKCLTRCKVLSIIGFTTLPLIIVINILIVLGVLSNLIIALLT